VAAVIPAKPRRKNEARKRRLLTDPLDDLFRM
jgi:hypothetical protein